MKILTTISRLLIGLVFAFSGFIKAVDPLGTTYKFNDYLLALGLGFMVPLSFFLALILITSEFSIGISLLLNVKIKLASLGALLLMIIFTPLTLYLAIKNPVHDCGCFGDAIELTNWQTFWKNIILLFFVLILFSNKNKIEPYLNNVKELMAVSGVILIILIFQFYCMRYYIPVFDFRPYTIGTRIPDKMIYPANAAKDEYKTFLYYKKDGVVKEFTQDNYPWKDSTWVWVDTKPVLIKKGFEPPIHDFTITTYPQNKNDTTNGTNITDLVLADVNPNFLVIAYNLKKTNVNAFAKIDLLANYCASKGYSIYCLTSSNENEIDELKKGFKYALNFCKTDETTLKTIIRSNPGLLLLKKGTIYKKWHSADIPEIQHFDKILSELPKN
jgi:uncharacterized membrane protein YphA (DoxX/SURF4 family)